MLGEFSVNTSSSSGGSSWLSSIEGDIQGDINGLINDVAKSLNIHDFYSAHLLDYCEVLLAHPHSCRWLPDTVRRATILHHRYRTQLRNRARTSLRARIIRPSSPSIPQPYCRASSSQARIFRSSNGLQRSKMLSWRSRRPARLCSCSTVLESALRA